VVDAVEIDGELLDIGRRWFGLRPGPRLRLHAEDARPFLRTATGRYDAIFVDAYRQPYIPFYLTTKEFFALVADRLAPGGIMAINIGHPESSDALEQVLTATAATAFANVVRDPVERVNTVLLASNGPLSAGRLAAATAALPADLRPIAADAAARLAPPLRGGEVYTDDRAPVEWLVDESIVAYAAGERE
jgi:spermidine synthase